MCLLEGQERRDTEGRREKHKERKSERAREKERVGKSGAHR